MDNVGTALVTLSTKAATTSYIQFHVRRKEEISRKRELEPGLLNLSGRAQDWV